MKLFEDNDEGFSLLEVIVATLVLSLTFGVVLPIMGEAPGRLVESRDLASAMRVASTVMERSILLADYDVLPRTGEQGDWSWELDGTPLDEGALVDADFPLVLEARAWKAGEPERVWVTLKRVVWVHEP